MSHDRITISEDDVSISQHIDAELTKALQGALPQAENISFALSARDAEGMLVGGVAASTSYGWMLVKLLWVGEAHRGRGVGRDLMEQAEQRGRQIGCHGAWLDTSNPDAMRFYAQLGYAPFGELANASGQHPETHRRWFMKKMF